jgi:hypothetical protein
LPAGARGATSGVKTMRLAPKPLAAAVAATTAVAALIALGAGVLTPTPGNAICTGACAAYPYADPSLVAAYVPADFLWMYPTLVALLAFVALVGCLFIFAVAEARLPGLLALCFALLGAALLGVDYFVQLAAVQPSLLRGEGAGVAALSLFNAHGVFVALEDGGYWLIGLGLLMAAPTVDGRGRTEGIARWTFGLAGVLAVAGLPVLAVISGADLGFRYEIPVILVVYLALIVGGGALAVGFRRAALSPAGASDGSGTRV